jgi:hypothetical protein
MRFSNPRRIILLFIIHFAPGVASGDDMPDILPPLDQDGSNL